jgi:hypothetical protein
VRGMEGKVGKQVDRLVKGAVEGAGKVKEGIENGSFADLLPCSPACLLCPLFHFLLLTR